MTKKTDNIIEFIRDDSDLFFLLGALTDAYSQLNDLAKKEYITSLQRKQETADNYYAQKLQSLINSLTGEEE